MDDLGMATDVALNAASSESMGVSESSSASSTSACAPRAEEGGEPTPDVENPDTPSFREGGVASDVELVIVSGMSGAGRTEAMHVFEDLGYFCVDNLPPALIDDLLSTVNVTDQFEGRRKIAVVCDARTQGFRNSMRTELAKLEAHGLVPSVLFLDADDARLIARYKSSRRRHPLCRDGATVSRGIARERELLHTLKERANHVIDTTTMLPAELRAKISSWYSSGACQTGLSVTVYSFGFKHGAPLDADLVIDVRFLPNPFYEPDLRYLTGLDEPVRNFVMFNSATETFLKRWEALLDCVMPGYVTEGKQQLAIAVGCTGGQHRSVALAEATGDYLRTNGYRVSVAHRDLSLAEQADGSLVNSDTAEGEGAPPRSATRKAHANSGGAHGQAR